MSAYLQPSAVRNPNEFLVNRMHKAAAPENLTRVVTEPHDQGGAEADGADEDGPPASSPNETAPPGPSKFMDEITMKYMMNPQYHKQYLAKTDYSKYQQIQAKTQHVDIYQDDIQHIVKELLADFVVNGNFTKYTTELNETFEAFMNTCVAYLDEHAADYQEVEVLFTEPKKPRAGGRPRP